MVCPWLTQKTLLLVSLEILPCNALHHTVYRTSVLPQVLEEPHLFIYSQAFFSLLNQFPSPYDIQYKPSHIDSILIVFAVAPCQSICEGELKDFLLVIKVIHGHIENYIKQ